LASSFSLSPLIVHNPNPMKESEAANGIISMGTIVVMNCPATTAIAWLATVAKKTANITL